MTEHELEGLPRPCTKFKDGTPKEWFGKIMEEVLEAHEKATARDLSDARKKYLVSEELTDIITVCTSYLDALGYDLDARMELQRAVNEKNRRRGYFE